MSEELGMTVSKKEFGEWYLEVIQKAGITDQRYPVKGFPAYLPWGVFLIRDVTKMIETELEKTGHGPVAFPVVIPESNLTKEKEHVKGFEGEVFWITHAGHNKLEERLFLRPTSETAFYPLYSLWVRTHNDLPLKMYQSCQVYRYETKMTKPLIRGREFFWIEGHTVQKTAEDAMKQVEEDMTITERVLKEKLGIPFILMQRPEWDKFPGAVNTYAYDIQMPDGRSMQIGTTHDLGQHFSKAFNIQFLDERERKQYAHQTCYGPGISRFVAAIISIHGDDRGLVLPPEVAPVQIVVIPIPVKGSEKSASKKAEELFEKLSKSYRTKLDNRGYRPGFKFNEWELRGVPVRLEIGPNELKKKQVQLVRRDTGEKLAVAEKDLDKAVAKLMKEIFENMKKRAVLSVHEASNIAELKKALEKGGFVRVPFCSISEGEACDEKIKELGAEVRGSKLGENSKPKGPCVICGKKATCVAYVAKAY